MSIRYALLVSYSSIYITDVTWAKYAEEGAQIHETRRCPNSSPNPEYVFLCRICNTVVLFSNIS
jgi:hypothetical protein